MGVPSAEIENAPSQQQTDAFELLSIAADRANLPIRIIRFASDVAEIENVRVCDKSFQYSTMSMIQLQTLFGSFNLPVSNTASAKYLNDATSSAYHHWQRNSLGAGLTVSDIDLWRVRDDGTPEIVFELKRSYYDLPKWKPFLDDYRNFKLVSNLCRACSFQFKIIYNQRIKEPFQDKIDKLKIFSVDFSKEPPISEDGIIMLNEFETL